MSAQPMTTPIMAPTVAPQLPAAVPGDQRRAAPARPQLELVPAAPVTPARTPFVLLVITLLAGGLVALLLLNTVVAQHAFRLHDLQKRGTALTEREQELQRLVEAQKAPAALAERAAGVGMVPGGDPLFLRLSDGAVLGVVPPPPPPAPVPAAPPVAPARAVRPLATPPPAPRAGGPQAAARRVATPAPRPTARAATTSRPTPSTPPARPSPGVSP